MDQRDELRQIANSKGLQPAAELRQHLTTVSALTDRSAGNPRHGGAAVANPASSRREHLEEIVMDDTSKRGPTDRTRINLSQDYEVKYWTRELGVTKAALAAAIKEAGTSTEKVRSYLKKH